MRLTPKQQSIISTSFTKFFGTEPHLWLFGSRVDDDKRGGDIDLYIETDNLDTAWLMSQRNKWSIYLIMQLGDQKIDIVINQIPHQVNLPIYKVARQTGVILV